MYKRQDKTQVVHLDEGFDFLGFRIQRHTQKGGTRSYVYSCLLYTSRGFQVDTGRLDGLVTEDVGDLLDRCAAFHQPGRQRMPQRVHAMAAFLAHRNVCCAGMFDQNLMQMILVGERADRGHVPHEHLRAVAVRPVSYTHLDVYKRQPLGRAVPQYGFRPTFVARPPAAG